MRYKWTIQASETASFLTKFECKIAENLELTIYEGHLTRAVFVSKDNFTIAEDHGCSFNWRKFLLDVEKANPDLEWNIGAICADVEQLYSLIKQINYTPFLGPNNESTNNQ